MTREDAALDLYKKLIDSVPELWSVGVGGPGLIVYLASRRSTHKIPEFHEGLRVTIRVVGRILPAGPSCW